MAEPITELTVVPLNPAVGQVKEGEAEEGDRTHSALQQNRNSSDLSQDCVETGPPNRASRPLDKDTLPREDRLASSVGDQRYDDLIQHDLDDAYLLLDHLSGRGDRSIAGIELDHRDKSGQKLNLIDAVCQIKWPAAQEQVASEQAAILFKARDKLNQLASPATGLTIAYTLLVAPDARSESQFSSKDKVPFCNGYPHSFARRAYPHLIESAQRCRKWIDRLPMLMILALIVTTLLSWYVSYGKFILLRIEQLDSQRAEIAAALDLVEKPRPAVTSSGKPARGKLSEAWLQDEQHLAQRCRDAKQDPQVSVSLLRACMATEQLERKRKAADEALTEWTSYALWLPQSAAAFAALLDGPIPKPMDDQLTSPEREEQWSANLVAILGNYVLPMMYGLLGAAAAATMNLKQKIRSSRLSPRDRRMNHVQLVLGVITGACIGLFFTVSGAGSSGAPLSGTSVPLSASALSFLAGFGVEGVFKMLENIMITVFGGQPRGPTSQPVR